MHCETSEKGLKLIDFATRNNMFISSFYFTLKDIHKTTWKSPDSVRINQISSKFNKNAQRIFFMSGRTEMLMWTSKIKGLE